MINGNKRLQTVAARPSSRSNLVDLFCGCGGFSLGAHLAGFNVSAAFDIDPNLTYSFKHNFPNTRLFLRNVERLRGQDIVAAAGGSVDGIFGGPPCQGFSEIGRRDSEDPRRQLLGHFFRLVSEVEPSFFIMENVRGLAFESSRGLLDQALNGVRDRYAILGPHVWEASQFGAATKRNRIFVLGIHKDQGDGFTREEIEVWKRPSSSVRAAIADLQDAVRVEDEGKFDVWRFGRPGRPTTYAQALRAITKRFTGHCATIHRADVAARYAAVVPGTIEPVGWHPRLHWDGLCPTLRAGTGSDRGSYQSVRPLHPSEARVITVREAARLQGFPDNHRFHPTNWHSFRMIGNSVPPMVASAMFSAVASRMDVRPAVVRAA